MLSSITLQLTSLLVIFLVPLISSVQHHSALYESCKDTRTVLRINNKTLDIFLKWRKRKFQLTFSLKPRLEGPSVIRVAKQPCKPVNKSGTSVMKRKFGLKYFGNATQVNFLALHIEFLNDATKPPIICTVYPSANFLDIVQIDSTSIHEATSENFCVIDNLESTRGKSVSEIRKMNSATRYKIIFASAGSILLVMFLVGIIGFILHRIMKIRHKKKMKKKRLEEEDMSILSVIDEELIINIYERYM